MRASTFLLDGSEGIELFAYRWLPEEDRAPRAAVQIAHGMGEHAGRYEPLAARLTRAGYAVYAHDQRGHGRTAPTPLDLGHLGDRDGWSRLVDDLRALNRRIAEELPDAPRVLLGHSMGALLAQQFLIESGDAVQAAVLSGSSGDRGPLQRVGLWIARLERLRQGRRGRSRLLRWMLFGRANGEFEPTRTEFDWLSRDRDQVARYVADPHCGFVLRNQSLCDMLEALRRIHSPAALKRVPAGLPIYVLSGEEDPTHAGLRGLERMLAAFEAAGLRRVSRRIYERGRHEMLNEVNREQVCDELIRWLDASV